MKINKKILPFLFMGLSTFTGKAQTENIETGDSINNLEIIAQESSVETSEDKTTLKLTSLNFQEIPDEKELREDEIELQNNLNNIIDSYNNNPEKRKIEFFQKLLNIAPNRKDIYNRLQMPYEHVVYISNNLSSKALQDMGFNNGCELFADYFRRNPNIESKNACNVILDNNLFPHISNNYHIAESALNLALDNPLDINSNEKNQKVICKILDACLMEQNNPKAVEQYMRIFNTASQLIKNYSPDAPDTKKHLDAIDWFSKRIEIANKKIISGSLMDRTLSIKIPRDAVMQECTIAENKIVLTKIYNEAYCAIAFGDEKYNSNVAKNDQVRQIYNSYINAIKLQKKSDTGKISQTELTELNNIKKRYPETDLFYSYFSNAYIDDNKEIINFAVNLQNSKKNKTLPKDVIQIAKTRVDKIKGPKAVMETNGIIVPDFEEAPSSISYSEYKSSDLNINYIKEKIDRLLNEQLITIAGQKRIVKQMPDSVKDINMYTMQRIHQK